MRGAIRLLGLCVIVAGATGCLPEDLLDHLGGDPALGDAIAECEAAARENLDGCLDSGDADVCRAAFEAALVICNEAIAEPGEPEPDPRPDPDPVEPDGDCEQEAGELLRACIEAGEAPWDCEAAAEEAFWRCAEGDAPGEPEEPVDPELPAEEACDAAAEEAFRACLESGERPRRCEARAEAAFWACFEDERPDEPAEPEWPDEPDHPEAACEQAAEAAFVGCMEQGGAPWECDRAAEAAFRACFEGGWPEPGEPQWPDEPEPPEAGCEEAAERAFVECMEQGAAPWACERAAQEALWGCLEGGQPEEPAEPEWPEAGCEEEAQAVFAGCMERGGAPWDCERAAEEALWQCFEGQPEEPAEPEEPGLPEEQCLRDSEAIFVECVESGQPRLICEQVSGEALRRCLGAWPEPGEPEDPAEPEEPEEPEQPAHPDEACLLASEAVFVECVEGGEPRWVCEQVSADAFWQCLEGQNEGPGQPEEPQPPAGPDDDCFASAEADLRACMEDGADPEACFAEFEGALNACAL